MLSKVNQPSPLARVIAAAEKTVGYEVLSARTFSTQNRLFTIKCEVRHDRALTLLEEFVLRAGYDFRAAPVTRSELADWLSLDQRFIDHTWRELSNVGAVVDTAEKILLTSRGEQSYQTGKLPIPPQTVTRYVLVTGTEGHPHLLRDFPEKTSPSADQSLPGLSNQFDWMQMPWNTLFTDTWLQTAAAETHDPEHNPQEGQTLHLKPDQRPTETLMELNWTVLVIRDRLDDTLLVQVYPSPNQSIQFNLEALERRLREAIQTGRLQYSDLMTPDSLHRLQPPVINDPEEAAHTTMLRQKEQVAIAQQRTPEVTKAVTSHQPVANQVQLLRSDKIREVFLRDLKSAQRRAIIFSPWMNSQAVNGEMIDILKTLVERHVLVLLGWGIARSAQEEDKPPPPELLQQLRSLKTPTGLPGVVVLRVGNSHSKEVLIDDRIFLHGSHNWLSFRGDDERERRGESVSRYELPDQDIRTSLFSFFTKRIRSEDARLRKHPQEAEAVEILCAWIAVEAYAEAQAYALAQAFDHKRWDILALLAGTFAHPVYGVKPKHRIDLLETLGNRWSAAETPPPSAAPPMLPKYLRGLLLSLSQTDTDKDLAALFLAYEKDVWRQLGVVTADETPDQLRASTLTAVAPVKKLKHKGKS